MRNERDMFALQCEQCHAVLGIFVCDDFPEAFTRAVTRCGACILIEEAEQITREAARA